MTQLSPDFTAALKDLLGPKGWSDDPTRLEEHVTSFRGFVKGETPLIAMPASTEEAAALVKLCGEHRVAITPQGGNTGLVDGGTPHGEVCVSMRRMNKVRSIDVFNNSMVVEAGAPLVTAQAAAEEVNRLFPLSLGSEGTATIGGLISTNAGGVNVLRYGMMRDLLLGMEVVLPSGEIWDGLSGLRKNNTGYDLKHLFAGAEGTLGLITAATLKLFPQVQRATAWVTVESTADVIALLAHVREVAGDTVTSFEMIPANAVEMVIADIQGTRDPLPSNLEWRVLMEISFSDEAMARKTLETALESAFEKDLIQDAVIAESVAQARAMWMVRETIPLSKRAYGNSLNQDISVPVSKIPAFMEACNSRVKDVLPTAGFVIFGHVGDGNLHYSVIEPPELTGLKENAGPLTRIIYDTVMEHDGSISAEHGVGRLKRDELATIRPPAATDAMRAIKKALDPLNIMNPGRVVSV
ncbi:MAG: FAD-binding oxidoreductase [Hyphomonas sp.]|nr:FAD-binding oxidoreductase [Hyphomonas sp.]